VVQLRVCVSILGAFFNDKISKSIKESASSTVSDSSGALFEVLFVSIEAPDDLFESVVYKLVLCLCVIKLVWSVLLSVSVIKAISVIGALISYKLVKLLVVLLPSTLSVVSLCTTVVLHVPLCVVFFKSCQIQVQMVTLQVVLVDQQMYFVVAQRNIEASESFLEVALVELLS
jgi:hypothetical protein